MTWYQTTDNPEPYAWAESAKIRAEFQLIESSFNLFPVLAGQANKLTVIDPGGNRILADTPENIGIVTAVTPVGAGLVGGGTAGEVELSLDASALTNLADVADTDSLIVWDGSAPAFATFPVIRSVLGAPTLEGVDGIKVVETARTTSDPRKYTISIDLSTVDTETTVATTDLLTFYDDSAGRQRTITQEDFKNTLPITSSQTRISSITAGTGLTGGGSSGALTLDLDFSELAVETAIADDDTIPFYDTSATAPKKISLTNLIDNLGITAYTFTAPLVNTASDIALDISALTDSLDENTVDDADLVLIHDVTPTTGGLRKMTVSDLRDALGIVQNSLQRINAGSGLEGGGTGIVGISLSINAVTSTATNISNGDWLAFADVSRTGNPTRKITFGNFRKSLNIPTYTGGDGVDISNAFVISLNLSELTTIDSVQTTDFVAFEDTSDNNSSKKATFADVITQLGYDGYTEGTGIDINNRAFSLDLTELSAVSTLSATDYVVTTAGRMTISDFNKALRAL